MPAPRAKVGLRLWGPDMLRGFLLMSAVYGATYWFARSYDGPFGLAPAPRFCAAHDAGNTPCRRPDLLAFQVASYPAQLWLAIGGFRAWHRHPAPPTPHARLLDYLPRADRLVAAIFVYQIWDFVFSLSIPEHATPVFLAHHLVAAATAHYSMEYQMCHYYALFFGGCSEISTIFLAVCDLDVYFPVTLSEGADPGLLLTLWVFLVRFCQAMFVVSFLAYRIIGWWLVSYQLWRDAFFVLQHKGTTTKPSNRRTWFLGAFLATDLGLGLLQVYWFVAGMMPKIAEILGAS